MHTPAKYHIYLYKHIHTPVKYRVYLHKHTYAYTHILSHISKIKKSCPYKYEPSYLIIPITVTLCGLLKKSHDLLIYRWQAVVGETSNMFVKFSIKI